jgi:opacity protein-like surface antigen
MKKILLLLTVIIALALQAQAQKGNNEFQVAAQLAVPTGELADLAKTGYGASAKALFGFGTGRQQVTIEAGYNRWGVKDKFLPQGVNAEYRSIPIYTGYRYLLGSFYLESQAGVAINSVYASNAFQLESETKAYFAWAAGVGYSYKSFDLAVRYQSSDVKETSSDITFVGIRLGYRFPFANKSTN